MKNIIESVISKINRFLDKDNIGAVCDNMRIIIDREQKFPVEIKIFMTSIKRKLSVEDAIPNCTVTMEYDNYEHMLFIFNDKDNNKYEVIKSL